MGYWSDFSLSSFSLRVCVGTCCHSNVYWLFKIHVTGKHHWSRGTKHCLLHWSARVHIWHTIWQIHSGRVAVFSGILCVCVCVWFSTERTKRQSNFPRRHYFERWAGEIPRKEGSKELSELVESFIPPLTPIISPCLVLYFLFIRVKNFFAFHNNHNHSFLNSVICFQQVLIQD